MKDKILFWVGTTAITTLGVIVAALWSDIRSRPTTQEVRHIVKSEAPYVADRKLIDAQLKRGEAMEMKLTQTIERNTDAINALRLEIAKLSK